MMVVKDGNPFVMKKEALCRGIKTCLRAMSWGHFVLRTFFVPPLYLMPLIHGFRRCKLLGVIHSGQLQPFSSFCVRWLYNQGFGGGLLPRPLTSQKIVPKRSPLPVTYYELLAVSFSGWMTHSDSCRASPDRQGTSPSPKAGLWTGFSLVLLSVIHF